MKRWTVVSTRPNQEMRALANMTRQGFTAWLPSYRRKRRHAGRTDIVRAPLFSGYLFVLLDPDRDSWHSINGTFGVRRLICVCDRPAFLPDGFVAELRASASADGLVEPPEPKLTPGQAVALVEGPFAGSVAKLLALDGKGRVLVLLELLGSEVKTVMSADAITPVS